MSKESSDKSCIRVVIVDDHQIVRMGVRMMLEMLGENFVLVGEASDGAMALRVIEETRPDVVLMDLRMPGMDGLEAITHIRARWPQVAIVILTTYNENDLLLRALRAGVRGYLRKDASSETLFEAIRSAARGEILFQPDVVAHLVDDLPSAYFPGSNNRMDNETELTEREREVLLRIAQGERSKEIAARLGISLRTVGAHLTSIYTKLNVDSRASAVTVAMERGLLPRKT